MKKKNAMERLILAVDTADLESALDLFHRTRGQVGMYKIGLELFVSAGPMIIDRFLNEGSDVFLDLKLHDIPNTVRGAIRSALRKDISMLTLHGLGGEKMLRSAVEAVQSRTLQPGGHEMNLLAVSILTHHSLEDLKTIGIQGGVQEAALHLIELAASVGVNGCVCGPGEASLVRERLGEDFLIVCPGIRPAGYPVGDQARAATPYEAIRDGADYLVVGRPIRTATDPASVAKAVVDEIEEGLQARSKQRD